MAIKRLPVQLANQIAAGEVVERPSSVVKELVENSLDAGALSIEIDIEKGGHKRIRVKDNGSGIPKNELALALAPHSTSKIATLDDLENIASLGFRGEALASISAVSRLTLISKPAVQKQAWSAHTQGRDMQVDLQPAAHPNGTTIDVCDLFYNTPARRKFLRAEKTEFQHIEDIVKRIALSRPRASFILKHNGKVLKRWMSAKKEWENHRITQVCGNQFAQQAHKISLTYEGVTLNAWVGGIELMRSATDMQFSFVNGRAMRDKLLLHAIRQAYETSCTVVEQPAYVMFIDLHPNEVDVNVHPAKHEVRFQQARHIHDLVCKAFQDGLVEESVNDSNDPLHNSFRHTEPSHDYIQPLQDSHSLPSSLSSHKPTLTPFVRNGSSGSGAHARVRENRPYQAAVNAYTTLMSATENPWIKVNNKGLIKIIDNHVHWISAHFCTGWWIENALSDASMSQPLLMPVVVSTDKPLGEEITKQLAELNFELHFSGTKSVLKQVPATLRQLPWGRLFPAIINTLCSWEKISENTLCSLLAEVNVLLDDDINQHLNWYMNLPFDAQQNWEKKQSCKKSINDFTQWIKS